MAEFHFYGTWEDTWKHLQRIAAETSLVGAIDQWYTSPKVYEFTGVTDEVKRLVKKNPRIFFLSDRYTYFPFHFIGPTPSGLLRIDPEWSGPTLDLSFPACFECGEKVCIRSGRLFYQRRYIDPESEEYYKPPHELKQAFKEIQSVLKKDLTRLQTSYRMTGQRGVKNTKAPIWIGSNALRLLDEGIAKIGIGAEWKTRVDMSSRRNAK